MLNILMLILFHFLLKKMILVIIRVKKNFLSLGYFWHITDIHYDPKYATQGNAGSSKLICNQFNDLFIILQDDETSLFFFNLSRNWNIYIWIIFLISIL